MSAMVSFFAAGEPPASGAFLQPTKVKAGPWEKANRQKTLNIWNAVFADSLVNFMERVPIQCPRIHGADASSASQSISARLSRPGQATRWRRSTSPQPRAAGGHGPARY